MEIVNSLKPEYAGIVMFFPKSKRNTEPERAKELISLINPAIKTVAVVVAPTEEQIQIIEDCGFDIIQIHGEASDKIYKSSKLPAFKAFNVKDIDTLQRYSEMNNIIGYVFDAPQPGSGKPFDWSLIGDISTGNKLFILAGGLNPENVSEAIDYLHLDIVDVSSGVENDNGIGKSKKKAEAFVRAVRD